MNKQTNNETKAVCLLSLIGFLSVFPLALAKEGGTHVSGIDKVGGKHWVQRIEISGLLEAEYASAEAFDGSRSSSIALATAELAFDARVNEKVSAHLAFLYEDDGTPFDVDEAYIDIGFSKVHVQAGRMYVPFGTYETNMVSDPLTLEIGETRQSVVRLGSGFSNLQASAYMFNGTTLETGADDVVDQMGVRINYLSEGRDSTINVGFDYISNLDSGAITEYLDPVIELKTYVPARLIYINLSLGDLHFIAEHLKTDQFDVTEIGFKGNGAEIIATNLEVGYSLMIAGMESTIGLAMQSTEQAVVLGLPEEKTLLALSMNLYKDTALSFEYATSTDYAITDGGSGKDATSYKAQIAVGF